MSAVKKVYYPTKCEEKEQCKIETQTNESTNQVWGEELTKPTDPCEPKDKEEGEWENRLNKPKQKQTKPHTTLTVANQNIICCNKIIIFFIMCSLGPQGQWSNSYFRPTLFFFFFLTVQFKFSVFMVTKYPS